MEKPKTTKKPKPKTTKPRKVKPMEAKRPIAYGMTLKEALDRIDSDRYSWEDLEKMCNDIFPQIRKVQNQPSKISKGVPLQILYNVCRRTAMNLKDRPDERPQGSEHEATAINLLREFGVR